jgi:hypothetical protein
MLPEYIRIPPGATDASNSDTIYQLLTHAGKGNLAGVIKKVTESSRFFLGSPRIMERLEHWALLFRTEFADIHQLEKNLKDPLGQWAHTGHAMFQLRSGIWRVDHYLLESLTTADFVRANPRGTYLGKAGNRWARYEREERVVLNGEESRHRLEELMEEYH